MFDAVRNNPRFVQIFLALITIPFALFGVDAYFRNTRSSADAVAKVGSVEISTQEFDQAMRDRESSLRGQLGDAFNRSMLESPEYRSAVLERLIDEHALSAAIQQARLQVPDALVQQVIQGLPQFQDNGQFSLRLYEAIVRSQGLSAQGFEAKVRTSLAQQLFLAPVVESAAVSQLTARRWMALGAEQRTLAEWVLEAGKFLSEVKLADDAVRKYYDANQARFRVPERAKVEYVILSAEDMLGRVEVSDADVKKWYDEHADRFQAPEERRARHILVQADKAAATDVRQAARKKAEDLLAKVKANPEKFESISKESSDDKMSAVHGGDLGFFGKGAMVKAFEDAVFSLKPKEISGIVETDFGFHIIQLTDLKPGKVKGLEEVRAEVLDEVRKQVANKQFGELADQFSNTVYEQPDALKPVADKFGLKLQQTDWIAREVPTGTAIDNPKVQAALFSPDAIKGRRNIEAVDLGDGKLISARVIDYEPSVVKPFEAVKTDVEKLVAMDEAAKLARIQGEASLNKLKTGEVLSSASWSVPRIVQRGSPDLDEATRKAVFGASTKALPVFVGVAKPTGYSIYRIEKVATQDVAESDPRLKEVSQQYGRALGQEDARAFIAAVRDRLGVKIKESSVNEKGKP